MEQTTSWWRYGRLGPQQHPALVQILPECLSFSDRGPSNLTLKVHPLHRSAT